MTSKDFMVVAAHPDDAEVGMGGTISKLISSGKTGVIVDLADSSAATNGSTEDRQNEASRAAKILGIQDRVYLNMKDAYLEATPNSIHALIEVIRFFRPQILFTHALGDDHPDHDACSQIATRASYQSGLRSLKLKGEAFRPELNFYFSGQKQREASFCVDITSQMEIKIAAIRSYESQFSLDEERVATRLNRPDFIDRIEARGRFWGSQINKTYAEAFWSKQVPEVVEFPSRGYL